MFINQIVTSKEIQNQSDLSNQAVFIHAQKSRQKPKYFENENSF